MRISTVFGTTLALAVTVGGIAAPSIQAVQLADGTVSFEKSPRLIEATTTFKETDVWGATYYFTLEVPEDAGEPLGQVTINQRQGFEDIDFDLDDSRAFEGTRWNKGERLTLREVTEDKETKTISATFDPPVMPGKTVTIGLRSVRNPGTGGVYLFGVTAFPVGEKPYGLYLGVGRLHFYDDGSLPFSLTPGFGCGQNQLVMCRQFLPILVSVSTNYYDHTPSLHLELRVASNKREK